MEQIQIDKQPLFGVCAFDLYAIQEGRNGKNKSKFSLCLIKCHAVKTRYVTLDGCELSTPRSRLSTHEDRMTGTHYRRGWVVPVTGLNAVEKSPSPVSEI